MSEITELAGNLFHPKAEYRFKIVSVPKRIRGVLAGSVIFDTTSSKLVSEHKWTRQYWIPRSDFLPAAIFESAPSISGIQRSTATLTVKDKSVDALLVPEAFNSELAGHVKIDLQALDQWLEEQTPITLHPKDPSHCIDILPAYRGIRVELNGTVLADTKTSGGAVTVWEPGLPVRCCLPRTAVRWEYLIKSSTNTGCLYKGEASYYNIVLADGTEVKDAVCCCKNPPGEINEIIGMLCFYSEKMEYFVDNVKSWRTGMPIEAGVDDPTREERTNRYEQRSCNC